MCEGCSRMFFSLWPSKPRKVYTKHGKSLRWWMKFQMVFHAVLFVFCFAFVGFANAMTNWLLLALAWSCMLTLRQCTCWLFYVMVIISMGLDITALFVGEKEGNIQLLGSIINMVITFCVSGKTFSMFYAFRKSGGIYGIGLEEALLEEKLLEGSKKIGGLLGTKGLELFEHQIQKDSNAELGIETPAGQGFGGLLSDAKNKMVSGVQSKLAESIKSGTKAVTDKVAKDLTESVNKQIKEVPNNLLENMRNVSSAQQQAELNEPQDQIEQGTYEPPVIEKKPTQALMKSTFESLQSEILSQPSKHSKLGKYEQEEN